MRLLRTALGLALAMAATTGVLFVTGAPADAASLLVFGSLTNTAASAEGTAAVYYDASANYLWVDVTAYDIKADGYAARAQVSIVDRDGSTAAVSSVAVASGGNGTSKMVMSPVDTDAADADHVKLLVWNGPNGPVVTKNIDLPI
jgi:hypothetical protein